MKTMIRHSAPTFPALLLAAAIPLAGLAAGPIPPLKQSKDTVRVAVAQMTIKPDELKSGRDSVDALLPWIKQAVGEKADLVVFPEYLLGAFHLPDALTDKLCAAAKDNKINVIVGGWEYLPGAKIQHPPEPGTYANSVLVIIQNEDDALDAGVVVGHG